MCSVKWYKWLLLSRHTLQGPVFLLSTMTHNSLGSSQVDLLSPHCPSGPPEDEARAAELADRETLWPPDCPHAGVVTNTPAHKQAAVNARKPPMLPYKCTHASNCCMLATRSRGVQLCQARTVHCHLSHRSTFPFSDSEPVAGFPSQLTVLTELSSQIAGAG